MIGHAATQPQIRSSPRWGRGRARSRIGDAVRRGAVADGVLHRATGLDVADLAEAAGRGDHLAAGDPAEGADAPQLPPALRRVADPDVPAEQPGGGVRLDGAEYHPRNDGGVQPDAIQLSGPEQAGDVDPARVHVPADRADHPVLRLVQGDRPDRQLPRPDGDLRGARAAVRDLAALGVLPEHPAGAGGGGLDRRCDPARAIIHVVLPLSLPGVIATSIFTFIVAWNEYLFALILMNTDRMKTLPVD